MQPRLPRKWLVSAPPLAYLLFFFAAPLAIMALASSARPGDFGGLAPLLLRDEAGRISTSPQAYAVLFSDFLYGWLFLKSFGYAALATVCASRRAIPSPCSSPAARAGTATSSCCS